MKMNLAPIGVIHSSHQRAEGTPLQAALAAGVQGTVEVFAEYAAGLRDLEGLSTLSRLAHVAGGHQHMADMMHHDPSLHNSATMKRRIIFFDLSAGERLLAGPEDDFGINVRRAPLFFVDAHLHTGEIYRVRDLAGGSGWGTVPTPMF